MLSKAEPSVVLLNGRNLGKSSVCPQGDASWIGAELTISEHSAGFQRPRKRTMNPPSSHREAVRTTSGATIDQSD